MSLSFELHSGLISGRVCRAPRIFELKYSLGSRFRGRRWVLQHPGNKAKA